MVVFGDFVKFKNHQSGWVVIVSGENNYTFGVPQKHLNSIDNAAVFQLLDQNATASGRPVKTSDNVIIRTQINGTNYFLTSTENSCQQVYLAPLPSSFTNVFRWKFEAPENTVINKKSIKFRFSPSLEIGYSGSAQCNGEKINFALQKNSISLGHYFEIVKISPTPLYPKPQPLNPQPQPLYPQPKPLYPLPTPLNPNPQPLNPEPMPLQPPLIPLDPPQPHEKCKWYESEKDGKCEINKFLIALGIVLLLLMVVAIFSQIK